MTIAAARAAASHSAGSGWAVGLDLSAPMLEVAGQLAAQAGVTNAGFVRGDAQADPLRGDSFDVLISKFGVMFFDNPHAAQILGDGRDLERTLAPIADDYAVRQRPDGVWVRAAAWLVTAHRA